MRSPPLGNGTRELREHVEMEPNSQRSHYLSAPGDLDEVAVAGFFDRGFLAVERLISDDTLRELRDAYDGVVERRLAAAGDRHLGGLIRQVKSPSTAHPIFAANEAIDHGLQIAAKLFGHSRFERFYEMLIDKPAGTIHETPWHQDLGYFGKPVARTGMSGRIEDIQI
jgi:hypothetical protein